MRSIFLTALCLSAGLISAAAQVAVDCDAEQCTIENNCRCSNANSPIDVSNLANYPQLIGLTFDEAVTADLVKDFWNPLLYERVNPDNVPVGATFFVPHEYTDYIKVNELYIYGFEIAIHSISKDPLQIYWRNATLEILEKEFCGQQQIISKFANIPKEDILGVRTPQLQLAGNISIEAYLSCGLAYDSSWPTLPSKKFFPYTLDYRSTQECTLGTVCPNEAFPGFWIIPINDLNGAEKECNVLFSCEVNGTREDIANWLLGEIDAIRTTSKTPLTLLVTSGWFENYPNAWDAFNDVLDQLLERKDTFLVTQKQILEWIKNPVTLDQFATDFPDQRASCNAVRCSFESPGSTTKYMGSCVPCPQSYPWLDNPDGN